MEHPKDIPGFPTLAAAAVYIESMDYGAQAELFGELAKCYAERSAADGKAKRTVLSSIGESVRGLAFALRDALEHLASVRPKKKAA